VRRPLRRLCRRFGHLPVAVAAAVLIVWTLAALGMNPLRFASAALGYVTLWHLTPLAVRWTWVAMGRPSPSLGGSDVAVTSSPALVARLPPALSPAPATTPDPGPKPVGAPSPLVAAGEPSK
jgi:hypothetical protein